MKKISSSLFQSIRKSDHTADIAEKMGEVALDTLLNNGLKDVPMFGLALSVLRAGNEIQAYFLTKKIIRFLHELEEATQEEINEFVETYEQDSDSDESIGEATMLLLEKMDNSILANILGLAFFLLIKGKIEKNTFEIYSYIIKNLNPYLIRQIKQFYGFGQMSSIDVYAALQLSNYGLVEVETLAVLSGAGSDGMRRSYRQTEFGKLFYERLIQKLD